MEIFSYSQVSPRPTVLCSSGFHQLVTAPPSVTARVVAVEPFVGTTFPVFPRSWGCTGKLGFCNIQSSADADTLGAALPSLLLLGAEQSGFFTLFLSSSAESCSSVNCFHALCKELHRMGVFWITARVLSVCWTRSPDPKGSSWVFSIASR